MSEENNVVPLPAVVVPEPPHSLEEIRQQALSLLEMFRIGLQDPNERIDAFLKLQNIWTHLSAEIQKPIEQLALERLGISRERFAFCLRGRPDEVDAALSFKPHSQVFQKEELAYPWDGFIGRYLEYAQYSEAHLGYHFWAGLILLGAVCKRNFYLDADNLYPNFFILLEGGSGTFKTAALKTARQVYRDVIQVMSESDDPLVQLKAPYEFPSQMTQRALLTQLRESGAKLAPGIRLKGNPDPKDLEHCGAVFVGEMTDLFSKEQFQSDKMVETLTSLYDGDFDESTDKHGRQRFENVALSMLMCSTLSWLRGSMSEKTFQGGFMGGRVLAFSKERSGRQYPWPPVLDPVARNSIVEELVGYATAERTRMQWMPEAKDYYAELYPTLSINAVDERLGSYYSRRQVHLRKLCLLVAINRGHQPWIHLGDVKTAWQLLRTEEPSMIACFTAMLNSEGKMVGEDIQRIIASRGGEVPYRDLNNQLTNKWIGKKGIIDSVLGQLATSGIIGFRDKYTVKTGGKRRGRPLRMVYLTNMRDSEGNAIWNPDYPSPLDEEPSVTESPRDDTD